MIKIVTTSEAFAALEERWNEMVAQCAKATPYQYHALCRLSWEMWKDKGDQLYIICHHKKEECVADAIFPCYLRNGELHWIDFHCDFDCPIDVSPQNERYEMYAEVVEHIQSNPSITMVSFSRILHDSPLLGYFHAMGGYTKIQVSNAYSVIPLLDNEPDTIASIATLVKQKQRKIKDIAKRGVKQTTKLYDPAADRYPGSDIVQLADHMVAEGIRDAAYMSNHFLSFFERLYEVGAIKVLISYEEDMPVASFFLLHDVHRNELIEWVLLYKHRRYNLQLMVHLLGIMKDRGIARLNLACGIYGYKMLNFHPEVHCVYAVHMWRTHSDYRRHTFRILMRSAIRSVAYRFTKLLKILEKQK